MMRGLFRSPVRFLAPILLIGAGGALIGYGAASSFPLLIWAGVPMAAGGIIWAVIILFLNSDSMASWFD